MSVADAATIANWVELGLFVGCFIGCAWALIRVLIKHRAVQQAGEKRSKGGQVSLFVHVLLLGCALIALLRGCFQLLYLPTLSSPSSSAFEVFGYLVLSSANCLGCLCAVTPLYLFWLWLSHKRVAVHPFHVAVWQVWYFSSAALFLGWTLIIMVAATLPNSALQLRQAMSVYLAVFLVVVGISIAFAPRSISILRTRALLVFSLIVPASFFLIGITALVGAFLPASDLTLFITETFLNIGLLIIPIAPLAVLHWPKRVGGQAATARSNPLAPQRPTTVEGQVIDYEDDELLSGLYLQDNAY